MKKLRMRWVIGGANLGVGIINGLILTGGIVLSGGGIPWTNILYIELICTFMLVITNLVLFSHLVIAPLKLLLLRVKSLGKKEISSPLSAAPIYELYELDRLLCSHAEYLKNVIAMGNTFLSEGGKQALILHSEDNMLGKTFQQLVKTLMHIEEHLEEMIKGHLFIDVPEELQAIEVGKSLQAMTLKIRTVFTGLRTEIKHLSMTNSQIMAMSQQGSRNAHLETQSIERISSSSQQVAENLRKVIQNIKLQGDSVDKTFTNIENMLTSIQDIRNSVESLSTSAEATSRSVSDTHVFMQDIETHAQSLAQISETVSTEAKEGLQAVAEVIEGNQTIKSTVEAAAEAIQRLGSESGRIEEILEVINNVAEQTNLLALNASIIAAQAGEQGRGFAVVANEIKELAERTRSSTNEIAEIILSVQSEVTRGIGMMKNSLEAVSKGVELANQSGTILEQIVRSIQDTKKMTSNLAKATVTQTENSQQMKQATEQISQRIEGLYTTASSQAKDSSNLAEIANILKEVTHHIDQSAAIQMQETDAIVLSIKDIQKMTQRNATIAHQLAALSGELDKLQGNLAENMAQFFVTTYQLPPDFEPGSPTVAYVYPSAPSFYNRIYQGIKNTLITNQFQPFVFYAEDNPVLQIEYINWLLQQNWLKGLILTPYNEQTGVRLIADAKKFGIPLVFVDRAVDENYITVLSDNKQGGECAAELLREKLTGKHVILSCGFRNIDPIITRMEEFNKKATSYHWQVVEVFTSVVDLNQAKQSILEGLTLTPNAEGIFLTNLYASLSYLELLQEGKIPIPNLYAVGYDMDPEIAKAIAEGRMFAAISQNREQLGVVAAQEMLALIQQTPSERSRISKEVLVPVKKITRENVGELRDY